MTFLDKVFSSKPSRSDFAQMVMRAFDKAGIKNVDHTEGDFSLKIGDRATVFLSNVYANYCGASRGVRQSVLSEFVAASASVSALPLIPSEFASAKRSLMPVVRDASYFSMVRLMNRKNGKDDPGLEVLTKPLVVGLVVGLAYDTERNITSINRDSFEEWGVSPDEAFAAAKDNLWERTDPNRLSGEAGVYWGQWADSYDSSRLVLTELIYRLSVDGDPVAFVPNRNELWVTGTKNLAGLASILKAGVESHFRQGHPLSPDLYVLVDGTWNVYVPEDQSLRELWLTIKRQRDAIDYAQQQELLNEMHEAQKIDIFVASYKVYERKDGTAYSACVWTNGIDTSLPRVENIAFLIDTESKDHFTVPWEAAASIVGELFEDEPDFTRAREFPSNEQVIRLRKLAI
jgi:hypothetical protein